MAVHRTRRRKRNGTAPRPKRDRANVRCGRKSCRKRYVIMLEPGADLPKCELCGGNLNIDPEVHRRHKHEKCHCSGVSLNPDTSPPHRVGTITADGACVHATPAAIADWEARQIAAELGGKMRRLGGDEDCPF